MTQGYLCPVNQVSSVFPKCTLSIMRGEGLVWIKRCTGRKVLQICSRRSAMGRHAVLQTVCTEEHALNTQSERPSQAAGSTLVHSVREE